MRPHSQICTRAGAILAVLLSAAAPSSTWADDDFAATRPPIGRDRLLTMSYCELEALFGTLQTAPLEKGYYRGTVLWGRRGSFRKAQATATRLVWQGKWICPEQATMLNRVFGKAAIPTDVYVGESLLVGGDAVVFDYHRTPARMYRSGRDEVRQVAPGLYLGALLVVPDCGCPKLINFFLLEAACPDACGRQTPDAPSRRGSVGCDRRPDPLWSTS